MSEKTDPKNAKADPKPPADEKTEESKPSVAETPEKEEAKPEAVKESAYTVERFLSSDGQLFTGLESHVLAGALAGHEPTDELTVTAVRKAADKFLNSEVQEG